MIKRITLALTLLFTISNMTAQEESVRFGAKAGLNLSNIKGDLTSDFKTRISFHIGALVEIPLSDRFAFQPELLYSSQGAKFEFKEGNNEVIVVENGKFVDVSENQYEEKETIIRNYINIPLMAKYYVAEGFSIQAGPQVGFLTSAKTKGENTDVYNSKKTVEKYDIDSTAGLSKVDFSLNFGLGYQLEAGIFFEGRYNLGLSNVIDSKEIKKVKRSNSVIQFSVGYKF